MYLEAEDPLAAAAVKAIHTGNVQELRRLLAENVELATARLGTGDSCGMSRTLLHVATDWPGNFPNVAEVIAALIEAGADVNARFTGPHTETPLHWAASSDDVAALDALLDAGANIEAPGAVIAGGTPLTDAVAFAQWKAAHRLVERGAQTFLSDEAALGLLARVENWFASADPPSPQEIDHAFWFACHGGQRAVAEYLLERGADRNWLPAWEKLTPLDAARRNGFNDFAEWLSSQGAKSAGELNR